MTGPTHKQFAVTGACLAAMIIYHEGLTQVNYFLSLPILLLTAKYGALFPDVDHHWASVKDKTVTNWIINKLIRVTGGKHRSWQTHSIDIVLVSSIISFYLPEILFNLGKITNVNKEVMSIILLGFMSGWISHIFSDMLTSAGVRLLCFKKHKVAIVPKSVGSFRFNTGHEWEEFVFKVMKIVNIVVGSICVIYPFIETVWFKGMVSSIRQVVFGM